MNIGVITDRADDAAQVADTLEGGAYLIVVDSEKLEALHVLPMAGKGAAIVPELLRWDCEAVVSGPIHKEAFERIAGASITRYFGPGLPLAEAVLLAEENALELITDHVGGTGCSSHGDAGECSCGVPDAE